VGGVTWLSGARIPSAMFPLTPVPLDAPFLGVVQEVLALVASRWCCKGSSYMLSGREPDSVVCVHETQSIVCQGESGVWRQYLRGGVLRVV
jgi:hypothetical protein